MKKIGVGEFIIGETEKEAINKVLESNRISEGYYVRQFEKKWAEFIGTKYCVSFNSGTSAIIAALTALKCLGTIKEGSKVITSPLTYIATANAIVASNLKPIFVDVDKNSFGITPNNIKKHLKAAKNHHEYSAILPVHLMGYPCDMDEINKIAKEYNLITFEDCAQSHGSKYKNKKAGALSLVSDFSFYMAHSIQAGEMGAITTNDENIKKLIKKIKANGRMCDCDVCYRSKGLCKKIIEHKLDDDFDPRFSHDVIGFNFKTMEFQAALALTQIEKIDEIISQRQRNVKYLNERLNKFKDLFQFPEYSKDISYLAYPLIIKDPEKISRKYLRFELEKKNIETRPLFGCIPTQQLAYSHLSKHYKQLLPNADYLGSNGFYIGCHQYLQKEQLDHIIQSFEEILRNI